MARRTARPQPDQTVELPALTRTCPACGAPLWAAYTTQRSVTTLSGTVRLRLPARGCPDPPPPPRPPWQRPPPPPPALPPAPGPGGRFALPEHEFGLDIIALIG